MSEYHQTQRPTAPAKRNTVPFIADVLRAKELNSKGVYQHTEAEILSYGNMWRIGDSVYQHVTISDGQTEVEIQTTIYDATDAYDELGWHDMKLRWQGSPDLSNLFGIIGKPINEQ